jgi:hypothetical protein
MQVNPIGVQTYQQYNRQENVSDKTDATNTTPTQAKKVTIKPQEQPTESRLAVKVPRGSYADNLTEAETRALELLFSRFNETGRFGPGYEGNNGEQAETTVGKVIDLKA